MLVCSCVTHLFYVQRNIIYSYYLFFLDARRHTYHISGIKIINSKLARESKNNKSRMFFIFYITLSRYFGLSRLPRRREMGIISLKKRRWYRADSAKSPKLQDSILTRMYLPRRRWRNGLSRTSVLPASLVSNGRGKGRNWRILLTEQ